MSMHDLADALGEQEKVRDVSTIRLRVSPSLWEELLAAGCVLETPGKTLVWGFPTTVDEALSGTRPPFVVD